MHSSKIDLSALIRLISAAECAAYETTANSLAFTLYMLARPENKSKVERLTAEIDAFGRKRVPTFEDLDKFPWLEVSSKIGTTKAMRTLTLHENSIIHLLASNVESLS